MILLHQPISQAAAFLVAKMWLVATPRDAFCYHKHRLFCLPDVLHVLPLVTNITPGRKGHFPPYPRSHIHVEYFNSIFQ